MGIETSVIEILGGDKKLVPIGFAAMVVMLAIWLTRLDDKVEVLATTQTRMKDRIHELTIMCSGDHHDKDRADLFNKYDKGD